MIFYLSGTGNTAWMAHRLSEALGERLIDIAREVGGSGEYHIAESEQLGFCFPVHGWRPPLMVRRFIQQLHVGNGGSCWAVCTAGTDIGIADRYLEHDLQVAGLRLDALYSVIMPNTYVGLPFMDVDSRRMEMRKREQAQRRVEEIIARIRSGEKGVRDVYPGALPRTKSRVLGAAFVKWLITDRPFRVSKERCVRCGRCSTVCPAQDIKGGPGLLPSWKHNGQCLTCFACYHHCPAHAIDFAGQTHQKGQYLWESGRVARR